MDLLNKSLNSAKASVEAEGFVLQDSQIELVFRKVSGAITHEEFLELAKTICK